MGVPVLLAGLHAGLPPGLHGGLVGGLLFPQRLLWSGAFEVFALVVAINSLVFLGLGIAKFLPWPRQVHPARVRQVVPEAFLKEHHMQAHPRQEEADPYLAARQAIAVHSTPVAMALAGLLTMVATVANLAFNRRASLGFAVATLAVAACFLALALYLHQGRGSASAASWGWSLLVGAYLVVASLSVLDQRNPLTLSLITMALTVLAPVAMDWRPALAVGLVGVVVATAAGIASAGIANAPWVLSLATALSLGFVLLQVRRSASDQIVAEQLAGNQLAVTDRLTGLLTRSGLLTLAPGLAAAVLASGERLHVALVSIEDLGEANADYGWTYGDALLEAVAHALAASLPPGELLARWGGRSFLALGPGPAPVVAALGEQLRAKLELTAVTLGKRPLQLSLGVADASPDERQLEQLVGEAAAASAPA